MRNASTLIERVTLSKAIEGELRTFEVDLHQTDGGYSVYVFDPDEAFDAEPLYFATAGEAKSVFLRFVTLIKEEPVSAIESPYDFAERVLWKLAICPHSDQSTVDSV